MLVGSFLLPVKQNASIIEGVRKSKVFLRFSFESFYTQLNVMAKSNGVNRKGSRIVSGRVAKPRRRTRLLNPHEIKAASTSASAKKLKNNDIDEIRISAAHGYRIINFLSMFSTLSHFIKCKACKGHITFAESSTRGLGFKLVIMCKNCEPRNINSCPLIKNAYEINRRIVIAMRLLGVGYERYSKILRFYGHFQNI